MISKSCFLLLIAVILCCVIYPLVLWCVAQFCFSFQANGSMVKEGNRAVGSLLIAQSFTQDRYFHPRPSACSYDASASASSSLAGSNPQLRDRVAKSIAPFAPQIVPGDFVTTSASGLDPHITLDNARFQLDRVANAWGALVKRDVRQEIEELLENTASQPLGGLAGEKYLNVLELNLTLSSMYGKQA